MAASPREPPRPPAPPLRLASCPGRLRRLRHLLLLPLVAGGAGVWLGMAGAAPMLVWWWLRRPRGDGADWQVDPDAVRSYRFGRFRTLLELRGAGAAVHRLEIFHDELAPADLARLRRRVKAGAAADRRR